MRAGRSTSSRLGLEHICLVHGIVLLTSSAFVFGGNIWWMRTLLSCWASLSLPIAIAAVVQSGEPGTVARRRAWWLLPWLGFVGLVVLSSLNPSFRPMIAEGSKVLVNLGARWPNLPSCTEPATALTELWFYAGIYLSAFNLLIVPVRRHHLRTLLYIGVATCLLIGVYGTMQKLLGAGFYFGAATSPNIRYFGTFIYNNHWGAFLTLWLAVAAGLIHHHASRHTGRDLWHSPFSLLLVALLLLAATAPLSASRAATAMAALIMAIALCHALLRICISRRSQGRSVWPPVTAVLVVASLTIAAVIWLAQHSINERYLETRSALVRDQSLFQGRLELYRDTWTLAMRKPWFGWGFESYAATFSLMRPRPLEANRQYESSYAEAHSDWLQSVAETGFVGTTLVILMGLLPLAASMRHRLRSPTVRYGLFGCSLILLYATIELPFANGAVLAAFWLIYFSLCRYAELDAHGRPAGITAHD